ncbi:hypothetical protein [Diaphorobacter limosus]|uniref:Uncharacterized protein n=1 Tax=Diaphorobacter limosus TaxID=3036128 RepID=A0ABZ0J505_9BURK|nr:hypothetical protein [Diaphorobacter sp. Y-1]WOO31938.1 hypothetical protein P4826_16280 [Diaphorobacter sp. Y-1]
MHPLNAWIPTVEGMTATLSQTQGREHPKHVTEPTPRAIARQAEIWRYQKNLKPPNHSAQDATGKEVVHMQHIVLFVLCTHLSKEQGRICVPNRMIL